MKVKKAKSHFEKATRLNPHFPDAWLQLAQLFYNDKEWDNAMACYEKALQINRSLVVPKLRMARIHLLNRDWNKFESTLEFYYNWVSPKLEDYHEGVWEETNLDKLRYWRKMCFYEDQVLELLHRKEMVQSLLQKSQ